jgi:hypothetical protein
MEGCRMILEYNRWEEAGRAGSSAGNRQVRQDHSARSGTEGGYWWLCAVACGQPGYLKLSHFNSFDMASEQSAGRNLADAFTE